MLWLKGEIRVIHFSCQVNCGPYPWFPVVIELQGIDWNPWFNMAESGPELPVLPAYRWTWGVLYWVINHSASSTLRTASTIQFTAVIPTQDIVIFLEECSHRTRAPFRLRESLWRLSTACGRGLCYGDPVGSLWSTYVLRMNSEPRNTLCWKMLF